MSAFWFLAGMLAMLAVMLVLLPWLRTIPRLEGLPSVPWQLPLISLVLIGGALAMYSRIGRPDLVAAQSAAPKMPTSNVAAMSGGDTRGASANAPAGANANAPAGSMNAAIASLQARLAKGTGSPDDWELLAKSYEFIGRPDDAAKARAHQLGSMAATPDALPTAAAQSVVLSSESQKSLSMAARDRREKHYAAAADIYKRLAASGQMNADAWADYADTTASIQGNKLAGQPEIFIAKALAADPNHAKALWLKASADEEAQRYAEAVLAWQRLQRALPPDSQDAKIVAANLQRDQEMAGKNAAASPSDSAGAVANGASVSGEVSIAGSLSSKATPGATLFIVAKSVDVPGPPVAIFRGSVGAWPVKFVLDDSSAMLPGRNLTNAKHITVEARISQSGQAQPAAGDLRGKTGVIDPATHQALKIVIDEVVS